MSVMNVLGKNTKFIKNRNGDICKVEGNLFGVKYILENKNIYVNYQKQFLASGEHKYDIVKELTPKSNPELYL